jgi:hypothetical protein
VLDRRQADGAAGGVDQDALAGLDPADVVSAYSAVTKAFRIEAASSNESPGA